MSGQVERQMSKCVCCPLAVSANDWTGRCGARPPARPTSRLSTGSFLGCQDSMCPCGPIHPLVANFPIRVFCAAGTLAQAKPSQPTGLTAMLPGASSCPSGPGWWSGV